MAQFDSRTGRTLGEPSAEQWEALKTYAAEHGRTWKSQLLDDWTYARTSGPLQQIRNQFGPRWLLSINILEKR